uniref:Uncharacterized protein n=1 Tax=Siphoviridae sp. ctsf32 TaxID=2827594 RepID=A0A8S5LNM4_9CAUD|nr:MAG TPA: hypothetical protein [Siphoviridae sp. ctsf32]
MLLLGNQLVLNNSFHGLIFVSLSAKQLNVVKTLSIEPISKFASKIFFNKVFNLSRRIVVQTIDQQKLSRIHVVPLLAYCLRRMFYYLHIHYSICVNKIQLNYKNSKLQYSITVTYCK